HEIETLEGMSRTPEEAVAEHLRVALLRHAPEFVGIQETQRLLGGLEQGYPELVRQTLQTISLQRLAEVFRRLLQERVCISNLRAILETLAQTGESSPLHVQVEGVRHALSRHICHQYADEHRAIGVYVLSRELELEIRREVFSEGGRTIAMPADLSDRLTRGLRAVPHATGRGGQAVLMTTPDMRRYIHHHLEKHGIDIPVMAYSELAQG